MKRKTTKIKPAIFKYLLALPLFLLTFCQSELEEPIDVSANKLTIDAKVLGLMKSVIQSDSDQILTQNKGSLSKDATIIDDGQCTNFLYPMTFEVFSKDDPIAEIREINSDEELIAFIETFTFENSTVASSPNYEMYIYFPIILLDADGLETVLNNLTELEGTLQMAVEACEGFNDGSDNGSGDDSEDDSNDDSDHDNSTDDNQSDNDKGFKYCDKNNKKVYICHKGKTICVSVNAIWGHMEHHEEDFLGTCDD